MKRKMTKKDRDRINRRFARRQQRRKHKRVSRNHKARAVLQNDCFVFYYKMTMGYNAIHGVEITGVDPLAVNARRYIIHTK